jgi:hypothetical protein
MTVGIPEFHAVAPEYGVTPGEAPHRRVPALLTAMSWLWSGVLSRFPKLRVGLAEGGIGWVPEERRRAVQPRGGARYRRRHPGLPDHPGPKLSGRVTVFVIVTGSRR